MKAIQIKQYGGEEQLEIVRSSNPPQTHESASTKQPSEN